MSILVGVLAGTTANHANVFMAIGFLEARKGYFAPKKAPNPAVQASQEIHDAVFSRRGSQGLPFEAATSVRKLSEGKYNLAVTMHLGEQGLDLVKEGDRYVGNFTIVTAIFDHDERYLTGAEKQVLLHLREADLEQVRARGLAVRVGFVLASGDYLVRNVVRDSGGVLSR